MYMYVCIYIYIYAYGNISKYVEIQLAIASATEQLPPEDQAALRSKLGSAGADAIFAANCSLPNTLHTLPPVSHVLHVLLCFCLHLVFLQDRYIYIIIYI